MHIAFLARNPTGTVTEGFLPAAERLGASSGSPALPRLPAPDVITAAPAPSTPLGPFQDSAVAWLTWVTLMGSIGLIALALVSAGPAARRLGADTLAAVTSRLARASVVLSVLAVPAVLSDLARGTSESGGYDYATAWQSLYDGSNAGRLSGIEVTLSLGAAALTAPLTLRPLAAGRARAWLLSGGLAAETVALGTTKFPATVPTNWPRTVFATVMWLLHLLGGAIWLGGLAGLALLALPGAIRPAQRDSFWSPAIRRFSAAAMSSVAAIALSGLFLYWEHVDGPSQLLRTMYGRVLGVKILIFGALLVLGIVNQFWLHPRIEALRARGDNRALHAVLVKQFPVIVTVEVLLGAAVLFVAPFLHGSARNQAFQAAAAKHSHSPIVAADLPKIATKHAGSATWVWGALETILVIGIVIGGYHISGRLARRRARAAPDEFVDDVRAVEVIGQAGRKHRHQARRSNPPED